MKKSLRLQVGVIATFMGLMPLVSVAGTVTDGVKTAEASNKDQYGYRFNALTAGLLAAKLQPSIVDKTVLFASLLPGLSCDSVMLAKDEFSWREAEKKLEAEFKSAAATFTATSVYTLSAIKLSDYDFSAGGFPYTGDILGFNNEFIDGKPVGRYAAFGGTGTQSGTINSKAATHNGSKMSPRAVSPDCSLYIEGSGGSQAQVDLVGSPYLLNGYIPLPEADARELVSRYPKRDFVLLMQFEISGSELSRDKNKVFLKSEKFQYSLCEGNPVEPYKNAKGELIVGDIRCAKVIMPIAMGPLRTAYPYYLDELPSWAAGGGGSGTGPLSADNIAKGLNSLFGKAAKMVGGSDSKDNADVVPTANEIAPQR